MSDSTFYIKQDDTLPKLSGKLLLEDGTVPPGLATASSLKFFMRKKGSTTPKVDGANATILDPSTGAFEYAWSAADTNVAGTFQGELQVTYSTGDLETFPNFDYLEIIITGDI